jgi:hypothetical protein
MMMVVGYRDLRPVDWASGKRLPLEAGEGHLCDRCGTEHAVVYDVQDTESGKIYQVGSTCAKKQFGFDVVEEARELVRASKKQDAAELDAIRQQMIVDEIPRIDLAISRLKIPDFVEDHKSYPGATCWRFGDSMALATRGQNDQEAKNIAFKDWVIHRIRDSIPPEWYNIEVLYDPKSRSRTMMSMGRRAEMVVLAYLQSH